MAREVKTITRTVKVLMLTNDRQKDLLQSTYKFVHDRAVAWCNVLLACRGEQYSLRNNDGSITTISAEESWAHIGSCDEETRAKLMEIYKGIIKKRHTREFVNPLKNKKADYNTKGPTAELVRELRASGFLPFKGMEISSRYHRLDFAAFQMAIQQISGWNTINNATIDNYNKEKSNLTILKDDIAKKYPNGMDLLKEFESNFIKDGEETSGYITKSFVSKVKKFGWDVRYARKAMAWCKEQCDNIELWRDVFEFRASERRFTRLRPDAAFKFADINHSFRQVPMGDNYLPFSISYRDGELLLSVNSLYEKTGKVVNEKIKLCLSRQLIDLKITSVGKTGSNYQMVYKKGNKSRETVVGCVKESSLFYHEGRDFLHLPIQIDKPIIGEDVSQLIEKYWAEPNDKPLVIPKGIKILSADVGLNPAWSYCVYEGGVATLEGQLGKIGDVSFLTAVKKLNRKVRSISHVVNYYKAISNSNTSDEIRTALAEKAFIHLGLKGVPSDVNELYPFLKDYKIKGSAKKNKGNLLKMDGSDDLVKAIRAFISVQVHNAVKLCNRLKQHDRPWLRNGERKVGRYRTRSNQESNLQPYFWKSGVYSEMFSWCDTYKKVMSLQKKWRYKSLKPVGKGLSRNGFEAHHLYLNNYKMNLLKKMSESIIRVAKNNGCSVVVLEDISLERSKANKSKSSNELASLWSPRTIKQWIEHFSVQDGIEVIFVDPRHTSQIDHETSRFGWRSNLDKTKLYVERGEDIVCLNADVNAAHNIYRRFVDRVGTVTRFFAKSVTNPGDFGMKEAWVPVVKVKEAEEESVDGQQDVKFKKWKKKLLQHFLECRYSTCNIIIDGDGNIKSLEGGQFGQVKTSKKEIQFYVDGDTLLTPSSRESRLSSIKQRAVKC